MEKSVATGRTARRRGNQEVSVPQQLLEGIIESFGKLRVLEEVGSTWRVLFPELVAEVKATTL